MAAQGNPKAGSLSIGDIDLDTAWDSLAGEIAREIAAESGRSNAAPHASSSIFGAGQSEAEAQLYAYLDRATTPRSSGFPPFDALSARLGEFSPVERDGYANAAASPYRGDLDWFELKFEDLKRILGRRDGDKPDIRSIDAKLSDIMERVDRLSAAMPKETTMAAMESRLAAVSRSLDTTREQSASDADRISRAAKEILAATEKAQEARAGFETAARHTVKELGQTVVVAASQAALVTFEQFAPVLHRTGGEHNGLVRVEEELRALNTQSRESGERTAAALDRVHETLRVFLERGQPGKDGPPLQQPRKRPGVHMPISADAPAYTRPDAGFGSEPARKPQLDTITLRSPPPPDSNFIKALQEADERLAAAKKHGADCAGTQTEPSPAASLFRASRFREEERGLPLVGLGIVAIMLLLASAALYYLHTTTHLVPFRLSVLPQGQVSARSPSSRVETARQTASRDNARHPSWRDFPALLTATEQTYTSPATKPDDAAEDLQMLTYAASHGDRDAQFRIGSRFLNDSALQDAAKAARWLARAADQGHTESQFILASLYERGAGVPKDETHAVALYRKAAGAGHVRAMHNLGVLLSTRDTPQDYREAAKWFIQAASLGLADSQYNLGLLYERGLGLEEDRKKAYFWYQIAAQAGDKEALQRSERLKRQLPPSDTESVSEQVGSWRPAVEDAPIGPGPSARG
jgi:localization factor PodJL